MIYRLGPRARRVYLALRDRIARGELGAGSQLPSHRALAIEFGVAPLTVRQVLSHLEDQGLVSRQPGRGTFVLVLSDLPLPTPAEGVEAIRSIRSRWPQLPLAAMIAGLDDLAGLLSTP